MEMSFLQNFHHWLHPKFVILTTSGTASDVKFCQNDVSISLLSYHNTIHFVQNKHNRHPQPWVWNVGFSPHLVLQKQGWFLACTKPMRDVITKQHRLSLAGRKPRISPEKLFFFSCHSGWITARVRFPPSTTHPPGTICVTANGIASLLSKPKTWSRCMWMGCSPIQASVPEVYPQQIQMTHYTSVECQVKNYFIFI